MGRNQLTAEFLRGGLEVALPLRDRGVEAQVDLFKKADEIDLDIEDFNKRVVTENFNRVVCEYLAGQIDATDAGTTLVTVPNVVATPQAYGGR